MFTLYNSDLHLLHLKKIQPGDAINGRLLNITTAHPFMKLFVDQEGGLRYLALHLIHLHPFVVVVA